MSASASQGMQRFSGSGMMPLEEPPAVQEAIGSASGQPAWITTEDRVLRFDCYFLEDIPRFSVRGDGVDKRTRRVSLCYYLADGTMSMNEHKQENSGCPAGKFMKRTLVARPPHLGEGYYGPDDLHLGGTLEVFGREITLVDADARTRKWYRDPDAQAHPRDLGESLEYPEDGFNALRAKSTKGPSTHQTKEKKNMHISEDIALKFFCAYEDDRPLGERKKYTLKYFVLDDTVEITEIAEEGTYGFPYLIKRGKLPTTCQVPSQAKESLEEVPTLTMVSWEDLACGSVLPVYGRPLLLLSCDPVTEEWYAQRGITQRPMQVDLDEGAVSAPKHIKDHLAEGEGPFSLNRAPPPKRVPAFNGFGSEDDLYAMGLSLQPRIDANMQAAYQKFMSAGNKVLRFTARLVGEGLSDLDRSREFVINYFLRDDMLSIFEPPMRNSGVTGGVFMARGRYKKNIPSDKPRPGTTLSRHQGALSRWIRATDFYPGAEVTFEMPSTGTTLYTMQVTGYDEFTQKVCDNDKVEFPQTKVELILIKLSEQLVSARTRARGAMRDIDREGRGRVSEDAFKRCIRQMEDRARNVFAGRLTDQELNQVCWEFTPRSESGEIAIEYDRFVDALVLAAPIPRAADQASEEKGKLEGEKLERALRKILRAQFSTSEGGRLRATFMEYDLDGTGLVDKEAWYNTLRRHKFHSIMDRVMADTLMRRYSPPGAKGKLSYNTLCDAIHPGDFDDFVQGLLLVLPPRPTPRDGAGLVITAPEDDDESFAKAATHDAPYLSKTLRNVNDAIRVEGGEDGELERAMQTFASSFGRTNRKKHMRKYFTAYDVANTGNINKDQFEKSIGFVMTEGFIDFDKRDKQLISDFFFPKEHTRVDYEELIMTLGARDMKHAWEMHNSAANAGERADDVFATARQTNQMYG